MKAMILAAGRGERLRPHTDITPKPLIQIGQHRLIEYHLFNLASAGINDVVINVSWLANQIRETLGDGSHYSLEIIYSDEGEEALETAGGIINALPYLGDEPFIVINGDVWCDYDLARLKQKRMEQEAHLLLVKNPEHNAQGDFALENGLVSNNGEQKLTFSGIGVYSPDFFQGSTPGKKPLGPMLRKKSELNEVSGEFYGGQWVDIGTIERLARLRSYLN
ncbi:MAG: nucleotidyltransferase family protein [Gammaproteobacteria bacterium]|nr:nucleotidyltransferase family protein [Gammaproteobacteria bacterium]